MTALARIPTSADRPPAYLSIASLARELDLHSETTVREMVARGILPKPVKLTNGTVRWRWADVDAALAALAAAEGALAGADPFMEGLKNVAR
jgi:predicted DNA-binding transcriptional regulator AlpA